MGWKLWYPTDVDLYGKRKPMLVANHENTLNISGYTAGSIYGNDIMTVEDTFGAGGICLFEDAAKPASPSRPRFSPAKGKGQLEDTRYAFDVVANGPLRSTARVRTMGWKSGRGEYELEQLYSAYKKKSYSTVRARYLKFNAPGPGVRLGCGFRKLANEFEFVREGGALMSLARNVDIFDPDVQNSSRRASSSSSWGRPWSSRKNTPGVPVHPRVRRQSSPGGSANVRPRFRIPDGRRLERRLAEQDR